MPQEQGHGGLHARQLWNLGHRPSTTTEYCTTITLPASGILSLATDQVVTLTSDVIFLPLCTSNVRHAQHRQNETINLLSIDAPFSASLMPLVYATATATVLAWVLVVMLTVTPRTLFHNSAAAAGTMSFASGRSILGGGSGGRLMGIGSRPWLQKAAALTVAISLTIATADTFKLSQSALLSGLTWGDALRARVVNTLEIRIVRTISNVFVWLAQVQTLIRLFPRHREKVLIKWIGFGFVVVDIIFSCLNSFLVDVHRRPRHFDDAIAALNYLFQLAVGLLYAAWVLYYSFGKRRYAYWHWKMKNISLIALLSVVSILTPVVFFVTDISCPSMAGWGDYFRWVGAAAASVIVWEWVERIEALERDEKKDGILGREIFDDDDTLDTNPSADMVYIRRRNDRYVISGSVEKQSSPKPDAGPTSGSGGTGLAMVRTTVRRLTRQGRREAGGEDTAASDGSRSPPRPTVATDVDGATTQVPGPSRSPVNRADTTSAASTVYVARHDYPANAPLPVRMLPGTTPEPQIREESPAEIADHQDESALTTTTATMMPKSWHRVSNPFKRKRTAPPVQIRAAMVQDDTTDGHGVKNVTGPGLASRMGFQAARNVYKRRRERTNMERDDEQPWIVIPVQSRGTAAWSPNQDTHALSNKQARTADASKPSNALQSGETTGAGPRITLDSDERNGDDINECK